MVTLHYLCGATGAEFGIAITSKYAQMVFKQRTFSKIINIGIAFKN